MTEQMTVLVAARDEEGQIAATVERLSAAFPEAVVVVVDDGSRDRTAAVAEASGARVLALPRRGKGQALTLAERTVGDGLAPAYKGEKSAAQALKELRVQVDELMKRGL